MGGRAEQTKGSKVVLCGRGGRRGVTPWDASEQIDSSGIEHGRSHSPVVRILWSFAYSGRSHSLVVRKIRPFA